MGERIKVGDGLGVSGERFLGAIKLAYRHVCFGDPDVGSTELGDELGAILAECMGDEGFQAWVRMSTPFGHDEDVYADEYLDNHPGQGAGGM